MGQQLETMLRTCAAPCTSAGIRSAELEFEVSPNPCEVSLVFWTGVFLSPGRRICVIGKETGPGPGGYG